MTCEVLCEVCGRLKGFLEDPVKHKCPPAWRCWAPGWLGQKPYEATRVYHSCSGWAAEHYVERMEREHADFSVALDAEVARVYVMADAVWRQRLEAAPGWAPSQGEPKLEVFDVIGEFVPQYYSSKKNSQELANG